jgi:hypothetical protein
MKRRDLLAIAGIALCVSRSGRGAGKDDERFFDVRQFGAAGDGKTKDTAAMQKAIDACAASGGGTVYLAPGTYLSGTVVLKDNVTFHLEAGATLLGSTDLADYLPQSGPPMKGDANAKHLLFARDAANVTVCGQGRIDGQGRAFWAPSNRVPPKPEDAWSDVATYDWKALDRPSPMVEFFNCKNLHIEDVTLANSSGWTLRPIECDTVVIRGIKIRNPIIGPNTDGIDPTCCRNLFISDCDIATGDDCICLKSEHPYGVMGVSKNIVITNCVMTCCCNGLKFGTATRGGFENIAFSNSVIYNDDVPLNARVISGIAIEMVDGGWVDGVAISNVRMQRVRTPVFIRLGDRNRGPEGKPGRMRGVMIENVHATGAILTSSITGLPDQIVEDVTLSNIRIDSEEAGQAEWAAHPVPEQAKSYPEARMFGRLPAYGFYCRHARGLNFTNVQVAAGGKEERPAMCFDDVRDLRVENSTASLRLVNVQRALVAGCEAPANAAVALAVEGAASSEIRAVGNDFSRAAKPLDIGGGPRPRP